MVFYKNHTVFFVKILLSLKKYDTMLLSVICFTYHSRFLGEYLSAASLTISKKIRYCLAKGERFMKYTFKTMQYNAKNFFYLFPLVLAPAFVLAFTLAREDIFAIVEKLQSGALSEITFKEIFQAVSIFNFASWETVIAGTLGVIALVVFGSLMMAFTDKHMRFGKRTLNGLFGKLNDNLMSTFGFTMLLFVIYELWTLLLAAGLKLCLQGSPTSAFILAPLLVLVMHVLLTYAISFIYLWLPCMQITGFRTFEALRYAFILCEPIQWRIVFSQAFSMLVAETLITIVTLYTPGSDILSIAVSTVCFAFVIMQFCVRMQIIYFDREQIERADLKQYYDVQ